MIDDVAQEIIFQLQFLQGSDNPLDSKFIKSNVNFHEDECFIFNHQAESMDDHEASSDSFPNPDTVFDKIINHAKTSCKEGLLKNLNPSSGSNCKSPSFSFSWTKSDPKQYGSVQFNGAGNVESTLS